MEINDAISKTQLTINSNKDSLNNIYFKKFSIIIPAYNEEKRIVSTLNQLCHFISETKFPWEIIISIDGNDGTEEIVKEMMKQFSFLRFLKGSGRNGKGNAIKRAVNIANGSYFILMDADNSVAFRDVLNAVPEIVNNDVVILERYSLAKNQIPFQRKLASRSFNLLVRSTLGINTKDTQSGYKILKGEYARKAFDSIMVTNAFYDVALLYDIKKLGGKIMEKQVTYNHDIQSKFNVISLALGLGISLLAFRIRYSPFYKYIPKKLRDLYYRKFRWI